MGMNHRSYTVGKEIDRGYITRLYVGGILHDKVRSRDEARAHSKGQVWCLGDAVISDLF